MSNDTIVSDNNQRVTDSAINDSLPSSINAIPSPVEKTGTGSGFNKASSSNRSLDNSTISDQQICVTEFLSSFPDVSVC